MFDTHIMTCLPGRRLIRLYLLILVPLFTPAWAAHSEATPTGPLQSAGGLLPVSESGAEADGAVSKVAGPVSRQAVRAENDSRKNMTGFFVIGMIINVLLMVVFLIWAVGQWRKTKK